MFLATGPMNCIVLLIGFCSMDYWTMNDLLPLYSTNSISAMDKTKGHVSYIFQSLELASICTTWLVSLAQCRQQSGSGKRTPWKKRRSRISNVWCSWTFFWLQAKQFSLQLLGTTYEVSYHMCVAPVPVWCLIAHQADSRSHWVETFRLFKAFLNLSS